MNKLEFEKFITPYHFFYNSDEIKEKFFKLGLRIIGTSSYLNQSLKIDLNKEIFRTNILVIKIQNIKSNEIFFQDICFNNSLSNYCSSYYNEKFESFYNNDYYTHQKNVIEYIFKRFCSEYLAQ